MVSRTRVNEFVIPFCLVYYTILITHKYRDCMPCIVLFMKFMYCVKLLLNTSTTSCQQKKARKTFKINFMQTNSTTYSMKKKVNQGCNELTVHGRSKKKCLALNKSVIKLLQNARLKFHSCLLCSRLSLLDHIKTLESKLSQT